MISLYSASAVGITNDVVFYFSLRLAKLNEEMKESDVQG